MDPGASNPEARPRGPAGDPETRRHRAAGAERGSGDGPHFQSPARRQVARDAPGPRDVCPACARVEQLGSLLAEGHVAEVARWATGRDARERARYVLQEGSIPWWRRAIQRLRGWGR